MGVLCEKYCLSVSFALVSNGNERLRDTNHKNNKPQTGLEEANSTNSMGVLVSELTWPVAFHLLQDCLVSCRQQSISRAAA